MTAWVSSWPRSCRVHPGGGGRPDLDGYLRQPAAPAERGGRRRPGRVVVRRQPARVVALSIDGNEAATGRTGARFAEAFAAAAAAGLHRTVHAGESSGPEGVWDAIDLLGAERIDHGVRAVEDAALVEELVRRRIPLGICPTSNVRLGVCARLPRPPAGAAATGGRAGLGQHRRPGTRSAPGWSGSTPASAGAADGPRPTISAIARTSIEAAFCSDEARGLACWPIGALRTRRKET